MELLIKFVNGKNYYFLEGEKYKLRWKTGQTHLAGFSLFLHQLNCLKIISIPLWGLWYIMHYDIMMTLKGAFYRKM